MRKSSTSDEGSQTPLLSAIWKQMFPPLAEEHGRATGRVIDAVDEAVVGIIGGALCVVNRVLYGIEELIELN